ncbi:3-oxoacyl-[acyl-carrier-protein] synthase II [Fistulifera solaris]|uniref:beta-ketoacyl-[acyl-carrier-protein] synthase I n=1 Tax=Fistulifera solaris TaxID=1519565 RepID=A0A1Z5KJU6_FISSO|nr:3-oxoacyl-[acyl-carrier-protein] synthase II [Fistulifera solaris]|eukprot:GAX26590.1 3-oxoacyl-[acyl-carrier-protein] synthase II [Fistulifera solaris]
MASRRRVVVTGIGAVTPLGLSFAETWQRLLQHESGITTLEQALIAQGDVVRDTEWSLARQLPCQVAAPVLNYDKPSSRTTSRFVQFALDATREAIREAKLDKWLPKPSSEETKWDDEPTNSTCSEDRRYRVGVSIGNGMSSVREVVNGTETIRDHGLRKLSPHFVPKVLGNSAAGRVSIEIGAKGPNICAATACAAGAHAIGEAFRCIRDNQADVMIAGGAEACIDAWSLSGFSRLRALSTAFNDNPTMSSRPFDADRDGFVMGEGGAVVVLEEMDHAVERLGLFSANGMIELVGYGLTGDAYHATAPDSQGRGAERAMEMALRELGNTPIDYVNAHATSTPKGDEIEALVLDRLVSTYQLDRPVYVSSTKGATGHLLGAAGALEAAITIQGLQQNTIPATLNLLESESNYSSFHHAREAITSSSLHVAVTNSFGFGGTNASLAFRKVK